MMTPTRPQPVPLDERVEAICKAALPPILVVTAILAVLRLVRLAIRAAFGGHRTTR